MKIPEALTRKVKRDSRYDDFIQRMHEENQKAAKKYLLGQDIVCEVTDDKYTVAFVEVSKSKRPVHVMIKNDLPGYPTAGGLFMNQWEPDHFYEFGINRSKWKLLSFQERAEIESALQLKKWVRKEFYKRFVELYYPEEYDYWWWNELPARRTLS